jgi:hypothetical protein
MQAIHDLSSLLSITHCKLYRFVPLHGSATYEEIARAAGLDEAKTRAILRYAMTRGFFQEPQKGYVAHTGPTALLATNAELRDWYGHLMLNIVPVVAALPKTYDKYGSSNEPTHSATNVAFDTTMDPMAYIAVGSTSGPRFAGAMKWLSKGGPFDDSFIVDSYPWADLGSGTVVDVSIIPLAFFER